MPQSSLVGWLFKSKTSGAEEPPASRLAALPNPVQRTSNISIAQENLRPNLSSSPIVQPPRLPPLPERYAIQRCSEQFITPFRRLNALLLPIPYQDTFYDETLRDPVISSLTRIVAHNIGATSELGSPQKVQASAILSQLVGAIRCRLIYSQPLVSSTKAPVLYISTIGILAPHRGYGLASHLLEEVTYAAKKDYDITAVEAHVWEANEDALDWYKRRGFVVVAKEGDYYRRLAPHTAAWLIRKEV
ncbi:MAG: hypothetical protein M1831_004557 [Alyxoria varia]|nr:MAG: hypothetical protein M1831_004557 [Alyxoria varia]